MKYLFCLLLFSTLIAEVKQTPNALINESSPYLQQHAYNPVQWYPWGSEAFAKAKKEHKLITLLINSIGEYFTHDTLIIQIWDDEIPDASHDNKLHQLVYRLNKKINAVTNSDTQLIENTYTLGYRIDHYS